MKKYNFNFNYAIVFYDVGEKRDNKVFKICKQYLHHYQNSVFKGPISVSLFLEMKEKLNKVIDKKYDFVTFILTMSESSFIEESIGNEKNKTESLII